MWSHKEVLTILKAACLVSATEQETLADEQISKRWERLREKWGTAITNFDLATLAPEGPVDVAKAELLALAEQILSEDLNW